MGRLKSFVIFMTGLVCTLAFVSHPQGSADRKYLLFALPVWMIAILVNGLREKRMREVSHG